METVIRVGIIYFFVLIVMRVIGKRDIAQTGMTREDFSITNALIGLSTLFGLTILNSIVCYLSERADKLVEGKPVVLFHNGQFIQDSLDRERVSADEVISTMHQAGIESLGRVKWVVLEPDGEIAIIPRVPGNNTQAPAVDKGMSAF